MPKISRFVSITRDAGNEGCKKWGMQDRRDREQERFWSFWTGELSEKWDAGLEGFRTGVIQDRRDAGKEGCRKGGMKKRRDSGLQDRCDLGLEGFKTGGIQKRRDAWQVGFRTGRIQEGWDSWDFSAPFIYLCASATCAIFFRLRHGGVVALTSMSCWSSGGCCCRPGTRRLRPGLGGGGPMAGSTQSPHLRIRCSLQKGFSQRSQTVWTWEI